MKWRWILPVPGNGFGSMGVRYILDMFVSKTINVMDFMQT